MGAYQTPQGFIEPKKSQFGELRVSEKTQIINLKSIYGISALRDIRTEVNGGVTTHTGAEYKLTTTASGTDSVIFDSAERARYIAGQDAEAGIGARVSGTFSGSQAARWGYFDDNDGFGFAVDANELVVFDRIGGTDTLVSQANWNADKLDGTGPSGYTLALADGHIYHVDFSWYGFGVIQFQVVMFNPTTFEQEVVTVHRLRKTGTTSTENPNLPIRAQVKNNGTAAAFDGLFISGRQFSTVGKFLPARRINGERTVGKTVSTAIIPLASLRRKSAFRSVSVKIEGFDIITDQPIVVEIRTGGTLTGATAGTPTSTTASETAVERDVAATAITGGELLWSGLVEATGSGGNRSGFAKVQLSDQDFIDLDWVSVCAVRVGSTDATVSVVFRVVEEW